jgi:hypothetical protein
MSAARRLYLYGVSAIALTLLCLGAVNLLGLVLDQVAGTAPLVGGFDREGLAVALALLLVGLPLWLVHWWLVERSVRRATPAGEADRRSDLRGFYLAMVAAVCLFFFAIQSTTVLEQALRLPLGADDPTASPLSGAIAVALVALAAWAFHVRTRHFDTLAGPLEGPAAGWSRLYLYGALLGGALVGLRGTAQLIETLGIATLGTGARFWSDAFSWSMTNAIALVVVGGAIWAGHHAYARRLTVAPDWRREAERASGVRAVHDVVGLAVMALVSMYAFADALRGVLAIPLGVGETDSLAHLAELTVGPIVTTLPFLVAGVYCGRSAVRDEERFVGLEAAVDTRRQTRLVLAAIGLAFAAVGASRAFGIGLEQLVGVSTFSYDSALKDELAQFAAYALVGLPVWLVAWAKIQRSGDLARPAESRSTARRGYLFLVIGVTVIAAGIATAFMAYQVIRSVLGVGEARLGADLSQPLAIAIVGGLLLAYHAWVLRGDLAVRSTLEAEAAVPVMAPVVGLPAIEAPATAARAVAVVEGSAAASATPAHEELVLEGPPGADLEPVNRLLREHLPTGWSLRVVSAGVAHGR